MKKFDKIANDIFLTLLEAPPPVPNANMGAEQPPIPTLPQQGGPVPEPKVSAPADRSPTEIKNWETVLLSWAAAAIENVKSNPTAVSPDDSKALTSGINVSNKDVIIEIIKRLAGQV